MDHFINLYASYGFSHHIGYAVIIFGMINSIVQILRKE